MSKVFITRLILKRFRSIASDTIDFGPMTILVGRNGAGKSNIIDAFRFLADAVGVPLQSALDMRGGVQAVRHRSAPTGYPPNLGMGIEFRLSNGNAPTRGRYAFEIRALPNYGFEVIREQCRLWKDNALVTWFERTGNDFSSSARGLQPSLDSQALALPVAGGVAEFAPLLKAMAGIRTYSLEPSQIREMQDPDSGTSLKPNGSNVASVLQELQRQRDDDYQQLCELLSAIAPGTIKVRPIQHGKKLSLQFEQAWGEKKSVKFEAFAISDGTLRALGILAAIFQHPSPTLLAVEEPEATLHPAALGVLMDAMELASRRSQVILTTHSPEVLDAEWIQPEHLRIVDWQAGTTRASMPGEAAKEAIRTHLMGAGELMRSNALKADNLFVESKPDQQVLFEV